MAQVRYTPKFKNPQATNKSVPNFTMTPTDCRQYIDNVKHYWSHRQHNFGHCLINDTNDMVYVNIPKNATNWAKDNLATLGWRHSNFVEYPEVVENKRVMVILRDPIERWVSGIAEFFVRYHPGIRVFDRHLLDVIFSCVTLDDHTEKQGYFLNGLENNQLVFFNCDSNLKRNMGSFLRNQGIDNALDYTRYVYAADEISPQYFYQTEFKKIINANPQYLEQLKKHFDHDIKLYNTVTFYG